MTVVAVVGPTASGKSAIAIEIAAQHRCEVVSVDSMQVYRGMDVGTAKATAQQRRRVPHHLIDLAEPEFELSAAEFQRKGRRVLAELGKRGVGAVICGGSGLHFRALVDHLEFPPRDPEHRAAAEALGPAAARAALEALDPQVADHVDLANPRRVIRALEIARITGLTPTQRAATPAAAAVRAYEPAIPFVGVGLDPGGALAERVRERFDRMLAAGLLDELERLRSHLGRLSSQAVGYKELMPVVEGASSLAEGRVAAINATMALAKRQRTFFRRDPRIHWISWDPDPAVRLRSVMDYLDGKSVWNS